MVTCIKNALLAVAIGGALVMEFSLVGFDNRALPQVQPPSGIQQARERMRKQASDAAASNAADAEALRRAQANKQDKR